MPTAFIVTGCTRGNQRTITNACAKHTEPPTTASTEVNGGGTCRSVIACNQGDPHKREEGTDDGRAPHAFLTPQHREQQRGKRHEREQNLTETSLHRDEPVVVTANPCRQSQCAAVGPATLGPEIWTRKPALPHCDVPVPGLRRDLPELSARARPARATRVVEDCGQSGLRGCGCYAARQPAVRAALS